MEHLRTRNQLGGKQLQSIGSPVSALAAFVAAVSSGVVRDGAWNEDVRLAKACHVSFPTSQRGELWRLGAVPRLLVIKIAFETKPTVTVSILLPSRLLLLYTSRMSRHLAFTIPYAHQS